MSANPTDPVVAAVTVVKPVLDEKVQAYINKQLERLRKASPMVADAVGPLAPAAYRLISDKGLADVKAILTKLRPEVLTELVKAMTNEELDAYNRDLADQTFQAALDSYAAQQLINSAVETALRVAVVAMFAAAGL